MLKSFPGQFLKSDSFFWLIVYLPFLFQLVRFLSSDFSAWDMEGHFLAARKFQDSIFPYLSGWNKDHFAGYPQGFLYPSLFHWLIGGLGRLLGLDLAFKLMLVLSILILPLSWFLLCKSHRLNGDGLRAAILLQLILYFAPKNSMGGDAFGTFFIGLVNQQWAMAFFYLYISMLAKIHDRNNWAYGGLFLGIICLSHAFVLFAAILATFAYFFAFGGAKNWKSLRDWLITVILGMLIGAAWWVPYLKYRVWGAGYGIPFLTLDQLHVWGDQFWATALLALIGVGLIFSLVKVFKKRRELSLSSARRAPMYFIALILILVTLVSSLDGVLDKSIFDSLPLHLYRLQFFVLTALGLFLAPFLQERPYRYALYGLALLSCLYGLRYSLVTKRAAFNIGFNLPQDSRVLVYQGPKSLFDFFLPHKLADSISLSEIPTMNGLFVESSKHSGLYMSTLFGIFQYPMSWGVKIPFYNTLMVREQLDALGVTSIVSKTPLPGEVRYNLPFVEVSENIKAEIFYNDASRMDFFHAYSLNTQYAEPIKKLQFIANDWDSHVWNWWTQKTKIGTTLIQGAETSAPEVGEGSSSALVRVRRLSDESIRIEAGRVYGGSK